LIFEDQGVTYVDHKVVREDWPALKQHLMDSGENVFGQLPVLVIGDKTLVQNYAIMRYVGEILGIYGDNLEEKYEINVAADGYLDVARDQLVIFGNDEEAKKLYWAEKCPAHLAKMDKLIAKNGGPFILGPKFSWMDTMLYLWADRCLPLVPDLTQKFPHLAKLHNGVASRPNIAAYLVSDRILK